jgi:outer membrane receptor for ferrienterochelin and colicin
MKKYIIKYFASLMILIFCFISSIFAGTTGKISGKVEDAESGQPLVGVNIIIEGTDMGAATDLTGNYVILHVPPGIYALKASMIGYKAFRYENVRVSIDLTTTIDFQLRTEILDLGEEVTVVAERPMVIKDLTATTAVMNAEQIASLPITEVNEAIELQAGLIRDAGGGFHIRGGRSGEVSYWIDGMPVTDVYDGGTVVEVNKDMVQELQVISGAFNAEYGQAMSGVVNIATKSGSNKFGGNFTTYLGDHLSNHTKEFMHINNFDPLGIRNFEGSIHGAIVKDKLFYYLNSRYINFDGWLYGKRKFNPNTYAIEIERAPKDFITEIAPEYLAESKEVDEGLINFLYIVGTNRTIDSLIVGGENLDALENNYKNGRGDNKYVPMNWNRKIYAQGKLIYKPFPSLSLSYDLIYDDVDFKEWGLDNERNYKYNPDGAPKKFSTGITNIVQLTHLLSSHTFYTLGCSYFSKEFQKYTFNDIHDPGYVHPNIGLQQPYSYKTGGTDNSRFNRETNTLIGKFDITSQVTNAHQLKSGVEFRKHKVYRKDITLQPVLEQSAYDFLTDSPYIKTRVLADSTIYASQYTHRPLEFSAYVQDKMEFKNMIVNFGVRFDYFDPDGVVLIDESDPSIFNPIRPENIYYDYGTDGIPNTYDSDGTEGNGLRDPGEKSVTLSERKKYWYKDASSKFSISPRIGVSFPITARGVIHFSYGHFFQVPRFERLYQNPDFELGSGTGNQGVIGNADLEPEQTINGEIGLQQQLTDDISMDITGYFRDIRNLAGTRAEEIVVYGGFARYSKIVNSDFGFVRGIIFALNKRFSGGLSASIDYTLQQAKGTNSDPEAARNALAGGSLPEVQLTSLDWDQRHTINATISYSAKSWGGGFIAQYGSGLPYTPRADQDISTLLTNNQKKPTFLNVDFRAYKDFKTSVGTFTLFLRVLNLFDKLNQVNVYNDTGKAGFTLDQEIAAKSNPPEVINTLDDWFINPTYYSEPRRIEVGLTYDF